MLNEALTAAELLEKDDFSLKVVNLPWLNRVDTGWLKETIGDCEMIFVLDNHSQFGGLGDQLLIGANSSDELRHKKYRKLAINEFPACGTPPEVLAYHKLDGKSIAATILKTAREG
jgi:transketolase